MAVNLARDPFRNLRPVRRAGIALAVLGLALAAIDGLTYWRHFSGENQNRVTLQALDAEIAAERQQLGRLREELSRLEVESLNERARFVNKQITKRTFSWSGLFDDLVSILPPQAQLVSLEPQFESGLRSQRELDLKPGEVMLQIDGLARDTTRLLALIDRFFTHPSFRRPDLERESQGDGLLNFRLRVVYRPGADEAAPPEADDATDATDDATDETVVEAATDESAVAAPAAEPVAGGDA